MSHIEDRVHAVTGYFAVGQMNPTLSNTYQVKTKETCTIIVRVKTWVDKIMATSGSILNHNIFVL